MKEAAHRPLQGVAGEVLFALLDQGGARSAVGDELGDGALIDIERAPLPSHALPSQCCTMHTGF
jgi:hypothetical protein